MNDSDFDSALRRLHSDAVAKVSARTRAQLRNRLMAPARPRPVHRFAWTAATAGVALFALVIGLQMHPPASTSSPAATAAVASENRADDITPDDITPYDTLDENPDFYLWLASSDAVAFASE